ncbi:MAG TPA: hypothetical protein VFF73_06700 [Planctomycetota bacterium]|nr:hypothetical protein [Planctomycetota bacterium]
MGSSPQDEKLALLVVRDGLLTAERLEECKKIQARLQPARSLAQVIVARHYATADQLRDLVAKEVTRRTSSRPAVILDPQELEREDQELARELGKLRLVEEAKIRECIALTRKAREAKPDVRLAQILLKKDYVTRDTLRDVLTNLASQGRVSPPRNTTLRPALDPSSLGEASSSNLAQRSATPPTARARTAPSGWPTGPSSGSNPVAPLFGASGPQPLFGEASGVVSGPLFGVDASSALGPALPDRASSARMMPLSGPPSGRITSGPRPVPNLDEPPREGGAEEPPFGFANPFAETLPFPDPWAKRAPGFEPDPQPQGFAPSFAPSPVFESPAPRGASPFDLPPGEPPIEPLLPLPPVASPLGLPAKDARGNYHTVELDPADPALPAIRRGAAGAPDEEDLTESPTMRHIEAPTGDPFGESRVDAAAFDAFGSAREAKPVPPRVGGATNFVPLDDSSGGGLNLFDSPAPFVPPERGALAKDPFASDEPLGLGRGSSGNADLGAGEDPFAPGGDGGDPFGAASLHSAPGLPAASIGLGAQEEEPPPEERPKRPTSGREKKQKTKATRARPRPNDDA